MITCNGWKLSLLLWVVLETASAFTPIKTPVVICPGFGNDEIDYVEPLKQPREVGLVAALERRGFDPDRIKIVPVQRPDWFRVAGGLLDINFYRNKALPTGGGYGWYIQRLKECVDRSFDESGGEKVLLIGHSAGGWLARAAMGDGVWCDESDEEIRTSERIRCLVTIGAIHRPPENIGTCVTRGALAYTNDNFSGSYLSNEGITYVSVGSDAIVGDNTKFGGETDADKLYAKRGEGSQSRTAYTSYEAVCGKGDVTGDGVVPLDWSMLEGSKQIKLEGVLHSINEAGTTLPTDRWYGSEGVIDRWLPSVLEEAGISTNDSISSEGSFLDLNSLQKWATQQVNSVQEVIQSF